MVWMFRILPVKTEVAIHSMNTYVWCWGKPVAQLMKFHLLQWKEVAKVKFLMNSNMTLKVLNLHQKTNSKVQQDFKGRGQYSKLKVQIKSHHNFVHLQPPTDVPTKYQVSTPYDFRDISWTKFCRSRSLWQGQRSNQGQTMTMHTHNSLQLNVRGCTWVMGAMRGHNLIQTC